MRTRVSLKKVNDDIIAKIEEISGQQVRKCFQCGKCTAGCPSIDSMDIMPNQIMKLLQMGETDEVVKSKTVWVCDCCFTCESRCPKGLDIAKVMEAVRQVVLRTNVDKVKPEEIEEEKYDGLPQAGLISCFRKFTG